MTQSEPLVDFLFDYHVHPDFSVDAAGTVDEYCRRAVEIGLDEICFTTHFDLCPERLATDGFVCVHGNRIPVTSDWLPRYLDAVERARHQFHPGLRVHAGLETDYLPVIEGQLRTILGGPQGRRLDFVMGSVHCLDGLALTIQAEGLELFNRHGEKGVLDTYYALVSGAVESGLFDVIGHFDIYRKCLPGTDALFEQASGLAEPVFRRMAEVGCGLEVNTGPLRKGIEDTFPGPRLLELAWRCGVRVVTTGSDAHHPSVLGRGLNLALSRLSQAGFGAVHTFEKREPRAHPLERALQPPRPQRETTSTL